MGFKNMASNLTFTDIALMTSMEKNKAIERMEQINDNVNWNSIEAILMEDYPVGNSKEGNQAYPPLLLMKCLLLQQWFHIDSDPELETQINDRISFKKFLGIAFDEPSPDHSTFSRFRGRLSKETLLSINKELLRQFATKGLVINEGAAVDARLVQSASRPISKEKLAAERQVRETSAGQKDRHGNPRKFFRDIESDWTIKNNKLHFGLKEHATVDVRHGFLLATHLTPASHSDSRYLPLCIAGSCSEAVIKAAYTDKGYAGEPNRSFLANRGIVDGIMSKAVRGRRLRDYEVARNKAISKVRYVVEQYFGLTHLHNNASRARFTTIIKNSVDGFLRQFAFNLQRGSRLLAV